MSAFILMLGVIGGAVWSAWAIRADRADDQAARIIAAADDEWLGTR